jgi:hypothetical protein
MNRLFNVKIPVGKNTRLSYNIFPELSGNDLQYPSTYTAVNLLFSDGTRLSGRKPLDAYEIPATALGQGVGKVLYPNQWNHVRVELGSIAAGKTISAIQLYYDKDGATTATVFQGWIDDIAIEANPKRIDGSSWSELGARTGREFKNRRETKPFKIGNSGAYQMFRLTIRGGADKVALSEIELLAKP